MEPSKQIKAVAQTYLQEQQIKQQADYIVMLENAIANIAESMDMSVEDLLNEMAMTDKAFKDLKRKLAKSDRAGMIASFDADIDAIDKHDATLDKLSKELADKLASRRTIHGLGGVKFPRNSKQGRALARKEGGERMAKEEDK